MSEAIKRPWVEDFSFVTAALRDKNVGALALVYDELARKQIEHTVPVAWSNGNWITPKKGQLDFTTIGIAISQRPIRQAAYLGLHGNMFFMGAGEEHEEIVTASDAAPRDIGMTRCIRAIDGELFVGGVRRQLYRRTSVNAWKYEGVDLNVSLNEDTICGFEAIDGFGVQEIYAVGWSGEIWQRGPTGWIRRPSPTNAILTGVCCADDGMVYICGRNGTVLRGRENRWDLLAAGFTAQDLWSVVCFEGTIYFSSSYQIFRLAGDSLMRVEFGDMSVRTCFHLCACDGAMWSVGAKDLLDFNGIHWVRLS